MRERWQCCSWSIRVKGNGFLLFCSFKFSVGLIIFDSKTAEPKSKDPSQKPSGGPARIVSPGCV